jgi:hypothetical protein
MRFFASFVSIVTAAYGANLQHGHPRSRFRAKFTCKAEMERREESLILTESQLYAFGSPL